METKPQQPNKQEDACFSLNAAIDALDLARDEINMKPVRDAFGFTGVLYLTTRVCFLSALAD
jgi:hypothetical protein